MPIYNYKGFDVTSGANKKGRIEAETERAAKQKLKQVNRIIVAEISEASQKSSSPGFQFSIGTPSVSTKELSMMVRQFAVLQESHVPIVESLNALISQVENRTLKDTLVTVKDSVSEGKSLADASAEFPKVFNRLYVNMVRAGESSGKLGTVLARLADFLEYQVNVSRQIVSAMTYPIIMIVISVLLVLYLFVSVVPNLAKVFEGMKVQLPWYTLLLMDLSKFITQYWYVALLGVLVVIWLVQKWYDSEKGKKQFDRWILKAPLFGSLVVRISISRFTKTLSTLLMSGVPIIQALDITKNVVSNSVVAGILEQAKEEVKEGKSLASCINRNDIFPGLVTHMIRTGEQTGQLEEMLGHVAKAYDSEVESKVEALISLVEPLMILVLFGIAGTVVVAMMLPMMTMMSQIR